MTPGRRPPAPDLTPGGAEVLRTTYTILAGLTIRALWIGTADAVTPPNVPRAHLTGALVHILEVSVCR